MKTLSLAALMVSMAAYPALADVVAPGPESLTLTLSQGGNALVHDQRTLDLPQGAVILRWDGISPQTINGSVMLQTSDATVREQTLQTTTLSTAAVRDLYLGRDVTVFWDDDPTRSGETLKLLSTKSPLLFQRGSQLVSGDPARVVYEGLAIPLSPLPALRAKLAVDKAGPRAATLTYLTGGLHWQANYTARYDGWQKLDLSSWASLTNHTGLNFPAARIRLLAGEQAQKVPEATPRMALAAVPMAADGNGIRRQTIGGLYHLYTLSEPLALNNGEDQQVPLLPVSTLTVKRQMVLDDSLSPYDTTNSDAPAQNPNLQLVLTNSLDQPLPAGALRIFQKDEQDEPVFMGEDMLPNLPAGEKATVSVGKAFDVTARRSLLERTSKPTAHDESEITESRWSIALKNAGARPAEVLVRERIYGDWTMLNESLPHTREGADVAVWTVPIPARGETVLTWKVQIR